MVEEAKEQRDDEQIIDNIGAMLRAEFDDAARERREYEIQWARDLRQYMGIYDPEIAAAIPDDKSRTNIRLTRAKVRTMDARMLDMLFPAGGDRNWSISPTPVPEIDEAQKRELVAQVQQAIAAGQIPPDEDGDLTDDEVETMVKELTERACEKMTVEIDDQLTEGKYEHVARSVIHSGNLYGTGVLKGPAIERRVEKRWRKTEDGVYEIFEREILRPFFEFVPIWAVYPDMSAMVPEDCEFIWQRHIMPRHQVLRLARRPGFDKKKIRKHLRENPQGDADYLAFETELKTINTKNAPVGARKKKYEVLERWGYMSGRDLADCGCDIGDDELDMEFEAHVWLLGSYVIKATLNPLDSGVRPFHFYYFEKDETSIFGNGIASIIRDPAKNYNALMRAAIDNAAAIAGPIGEANIDLLDDAEDPTTFHAFKMFLRGGTGVDGNSPALRFYNVPSRIRELLALAQLQRELIDETSAIPAYMQGEQTKGAAKTVGGLSMLMGAANITMKDVVKNFDDGVTKPFITALYHWNMQFNDKDEIKGDFQVKALGSTTLIAKEIRAQALDEFAASVKNPVDAPWIKNGALLRKRAAARDIEEDVIKTDEEFREDMEAGQPDPIDGTPNAPGMMPPGAMPTGAMSPEMAGMPG